MINPAAVSYDPAGLIPAIVQDATTGRVLMLGYMNEAALGQTIETGDVHFWSRSRRQLWRKGETSGNTLTDARVEMDCDGDALLVTAKPSGPTCHTGAVSCFGNGERFDRTLEQLAGTISSRLRERPSGSYTVALVDEGTVAIGRKVVEEATEVLLAAKDHENGAGSESRVAEEAADVVYHLLVLLAERGVGLEAVGEVLRQRAS